jgi:hypothetical protein
MVELPFGRSAHGGCSELHAAGVEEDVSGPGSPAPSR